MKFITGDLLADPDLKAIAHGCNCEGLMGAGIAKQIADKYPNVKSAYKLACAAGEFELGDCLAIPCTTIGENLGQPAMFYGPIVYNLATQHFPGRDASMWALRRSLETMRCDALTRGIKVVGAPLIGCGIGGLEWQHVRDVMLDEFSDSDVDLHVYAMAWGR